MSVSRRFGPFLRGELFRGASRARAGDVRPPREPSSPSPSPSRPEPDRLEPALSPLFDAEWYLARHAPSQPRSRALAHFMEEGWALGHDPSPLFRTAWYLRQHADVRQAGTNPLKHFVDHGCREARSPSPLFSVAFYRRQLGASLPDRDYFRHYLEVGAGKGHSPHPLFAAAWYLASNPDVAESGQNPLHHYLRWGAAQGRAPHPLFDSAWYVAHTEGVQESGLTPLEHYVLHRGRAGGDPHPLFDGQWYLARETDVGDAGLSALEHYVLYGNAEGRDPGPWFSSVWYSERYGQALDGPSTLLEHYLEHATEVDPSPDFDTSAYLRRHPDVATSNVNPLVHSLTRARLATRDDDDYDDYDDDDYGDAREPVPVAAEESDASAVERRLAAVSVGLPQQVTTLLDGGLDGVVDGTAFGWVRLASAVSPADVEVLIDGARRDATLSPMEPPRADGSLRVSFQVPGARAVPGEPSVLVVRHGPTGERAPGGPWSFDADSVHGHFDGVMATACSGWAVAADGSLPELELRLDGIPVAKGRPTHFRPDFIERRLTMRPMAFEIELPDAALDGYAHTISLHVARTGRPLPGGSRTFRYAPVGHIDFVSDDLVAGWTLNPDSLDAPFELELHLDGKLVSLGNSALTREDVKSVHGRIFTGFYLRIPRAEVRPGVARVVEVRLRGRSIGPFVGPRAVLPQSALIEFLEGMATDALRLNGGGRAAPDARQELLSWFRRVGVPRLLEAARSELRQGRAVVEMALASDLSAPSSSRPVAVIVPVYRGFEETRECLLGVLGAKVEVPFRVIVVDDRSPEPELSEWLRDLEGDGAVTLIANAENVGFVASVNRGMAAAGRSDVVLLNSDTEVSDGWLDRLVRAAHSAPDIGTVTPLSNRATICSVPRANVDNDLPEGWDTAALSRLCEAANGDEVIDIPSAVGFCMYIRRVVLDEVGTFDEKRWKKGYAEENDFSLRARAVGWRSVTATGCFVRHHGAVSFGLEKSARVRENLAELAQLYPDYHATVAAFVEEDPLRRARNRINVEVLSRRGRPHVLHLVHDLGGGTETAVANLAERLADDGLGSLIGRPWGERGIRIVDHDEAFEFLFELDDDAGDLRAALGRLDVRLVHLHHALGFDREVFELVRRLGAPQVASVHDYYWACPRVTLLDARGQFCGLRAPAGCARCVRDAELPKTVALQLAKSGDDVGAWRTTFGEVLGASQAVLCPSQDAATRMKGAFPDVTFKVRPHPDVRPRLDLIGDACDPEAVALIGAIGDAKGYLLLRELLRQSAAMAAPVEFRVVGYTRDDDALTMYPNCRVLGEYDAATLPAKLRQARARIALFISPWPETYSYTLSEALAHGLYPIALDLGANRERIEAEGWGTLLPPGASCAEILDAIQKASVRLRTERPAPGSIGASYESIWRDYYDQPPLERRELDSTTHATPAEASPAPRASVRIRTSAAEPGLT